jgi:hypothetical protein
MQIKCTKAYNILINDKQTSSLESIEEIHRMRYLFEPEIALLTQLLDLKITNVKEWLTPHPPEINSWSICFVIGVSQ